MAAESEVIKDWGDGTLTLTDGTTPTPVSLEVAFALGQFKLAGLSADQAEIKKYFIRKVLQTVRNGQETQPTGSFAAAMGGLSDATAEEVMDFVLFQNKYSTNVTTLSNGDTKCIDANWTVEGDDFGDTADHQVDITELHVVADISEGEPNQFGFAFEVLGSVSMT